MSTAPTFAELSGPVAAYLNSLSPKEVKAYHIAKSHLGTSFDLEKSVGYVAFLKTYVVDPGTTTQPSQNPAAAAPANTA
jgi:hypothetical protein